MRSSATHGTGRACKRACRQERMQQLCITLCQLLRPGMPASWRVRMQPLLNPAAPHLHPEVRARRQGSPAGVRQRHTQRGIAL